MNIPNPTIPKPVKLVAARIGLISDTHMPERCLALPASLFDAFQGIDILLHAGDLGELWVLDRLSAIAPVIAVHGNDDTQDARRELPSQQIVSVAGQRILLWHSHYPDPSEDKAKRGGPWGPKLAYLADQGRRAGAKIVVCGHFHIPFTIQYEEMLLVNPGALASGNLFTRQAVRTVALLSIFDNETSQVNHIDLANPGQDYQPEIDWEAGVESAVYRFQTMIMDENLIRDIRKLTKQTFTDYEALKAAILLLCHLCWAGEKQSITRAEIIRQIKDDTDILEEDKRKVIAVLSEHTDHAGLIHANGV